MMSTNSQNIRSGRLIAFVVARLWELMLHLSFRMSDAIVLLSFSWPTEILVSCRLRPQSVCSFHPYLVKKVWMSFSFCVFCRFVLFYKDLFTEKFLEYLVLLLHLWTFELYRQLLWEITNVGRLNLNDLLVLQMR